jgi:ABC-type sugar transport system substrate-binding protein
MRKHLGLAMAAGLAVAFAAHGAVAEKLKIGFLPGVVDPFYQVMQLGVEAAAKDLGADVVTQIPRADADPRFNGRARRPQVHHRCADRQGSDGRPTEGRL